MAAVVKVQLLNADALLRGFGEPIEARLQLGPSGLEPLRQARLGVAQPLERGAQLGARLLELCT